MVTVKSKDGTIFTRVGETKISKEIIAMVYNTEKQSSLPVTVTNSMKWIIIFVSGAIVIVIALLIYWIMLLRKREQKEYHHFVSKINRFS